MPDPVSPARRATRLAVAAARRSYASSSAALPTREELPFLLNARGLTGRGAEVGVFLAAFTEHLLDRWEGRELVAIDPWRSFGDGEYRDAMNSEQAEQDARYTSSCDRLARFGDRAAVWRMTGDEAAARIPDGSLDWVYLDARHDRESVAADLAAWWPKVRPGGVFAGHDYLEGRRGDTDFGVKPAVDAFAAQHGLEVCVTFLDAPFVSWVVDVPGGRTSVAGKGAGRALRSALLGARRLTRRP